MDFEIVTSKVGLKFWTRKEILSRVEAWPSFRMDVHFRLKEVSFVSRVYKA